MDRATSACKRRSDQPRADAYAFARTLYRSLHNGLNAELPGDLRRGLLGSLVALDGGARDHAESLDVYQFGDQRLGHSVGEIFLFGITGKILKGKNRQRGDPFAACPAAEWQRAQQYQPCEHN
jgi:hypothetical protein